MKKILMIAAVACVALTACDPEEEEKVLDPTGAFALTEKVIPWYGGSINADITTDFEWSITVADTSLLKIEPSEGKENAHVTVTLAKNTTNQAIPVSAVLTVTNKDKKLEVPFSFEIPAPSLEFGGVTYGVTYMTASTG